MSVNIAFSSAPALGRWTRLVLVCKARTCLFLGLFQQSQLALQELLQRAPQDVYALNSLAYAAQQAGDHETAHRLFSDVCKLTPQLSNAHFNVAFVAELLGRLDEAEAGFRAALVIEEKMDRAWYGLGLVLVRQRRLPEALLAFKRNTQLQGMSPYAWYQMARVHVDLHQLDEAREVIRHLKGFEPKVAAQLERETGLSPGREARTLRVS